MTPTRNSGPDLHFLAWLEAAGSAVLYVTGRPSMGRAVAAMLADSRLVGNGDDPAGLVVALEEVLVEPPEEAGEKTLLVVDRFEHFARDATEEERRRFRLLVQGLAYDPRQHRRLLLGVEPSSAPALEALGLPPMRRGETWWETEGESVAMDGAAIEVPGPREGQERRGAGPAEAVHPPDPESPGPAKKSWLRLVLPPAAGLALVGVTLAVLAPDLALWRDERALEDLGFTVQILGKDEDQTHLAYRQTRDAQLAEALERSRRLPAIHYLDLSGSSISDLGLLGGLSELRSLDLSRTPAEDLEPLGSLASLERLSLTATPVTELGPLVRLESLRHLGLGRTAVADLRPLAALVRLEGLDLSGAHIGDLETLRPLTGLRWLDLRDTAVSDLGPLRHLPGLEKLTLTGSRVADLAPLAGLTGLRWLVASHTPVSDLEPLRGLQALQWLVVSGTEVSDLAPVAELADLRWLVVRGAPVSDLTPVAGLGLLETCYLAGTEVADLGPLAGHASLQRLDLQGAPIEDFGPLAALPALRFVRLDPRQARRAEAAGLDFESLAIEVEVGEVPARWR